MSPAARVIAVLALCALAGCPFIACARRVPPIETARAVGGPIDADPAMAPARPHPASVALSPPGPVFTVAADGRRVVCCSGSKTEGGQVADMIWDMDVDGGNPRLLLRASHGAQVMPVRVEGPWLSWVEYRQDEEGALTWSLHARKDEGPVREIASNRSDPAVAFPNFELSGTKLVYDLFIGSPADGRDCPIMIHDLETGKTTELARIKGHDLFDPFVHGDTVAFCVLSAEKDGEPLSRLGTVSVDGGTIEMIEATTSGYQPSINATHILFKEAPSPYDYGAIRLYDRSSRKTITLTANGREGEQPVLGDAWAAWESPLFDGIPGWDLRRGMATSFAQGNTGKPYMKGATLVWVAEEEVGKPLIRFLSLD